jgi:iron(III) transport system permease protein
VPSASLGAAPTLDNAAPAPARPPSAQLQRPLPVDGWSLGAFAIAALFAAPLLAVVFLALSPSGGIWPHLAATVLPLYLLTTAWLLVGVGIGTLVIGVGTAWLVTMCRFPGRRLFEWTLLLPLAAPAYVAAYVYTDLLEYAGPLQRALRGLFGWSSAADYWFPEIRSLGGAIAMMSLVLYPYVYLLARAAFVEQSVCAIEVSRTLGKGPWGGFLRVALPLARPAIVVGVSLAMMEALNDFGTVDYFAVATFTAGIYDVWLNMNSTAGAAQLATVMLLLVVALIAGERLARRGRRFHHTSTRYRTLPGYRLVGFRALAAFVTCLLPVALGFAVPAAVLFLYAIDTPLASSSSRYFEDARNSLVLSGGTALVAAAIGLFLAYGLRLRGGRGLRAATRFAALGYAAPGAVLAVGVLIPLAALDNALDGVARSVLHLSIGLVFTGTLFALVYGYLVRFLALALGTVEAGLTKITPAIDGAARSLGCGPGRALLAVHLPMLKGSILTAALLVFVDTMKELPLTILLRPFNFDTLATSVHQLASSELLEESALGALTIVAAGVLPVIALSRTIGRARPGAGKEYK